MSISAFIYKFSLLKNTRFNNWKCSCMSTNKNNTWLSEYQLPEGKKHTHAHTRAHTHIWNVSQIFNMIPQDLVSFK